MSSQEDIDLQYELLAIHRRTLASYLKQRAALGGNFTPPGVDQGIYEAREHIRRVKGILRTWDEEVEDHPDDEADDIAGRRSAKPRRTQQHESLSQEPDSTFKQRQGVPAFDRPVLAPTNLALIEDVIANAFRLWNAYDEDAREISVQLLEWV
jgi:hypothetical protein